MKARTFVIALCSFGILVAAVGTLYIVRWQSIHTMQTPLDTLSDPDSGLAIAAYMKQALGIYADFTAGTITHDQMKSQALGLTVPAVLKQRHLEWVLALDAGRDDAIKAMMKEYQTIVEVNKVNK